MGVKDLCGEVGVKLGTYSSDLRLSNRADSDAGFGEQMDIFRLILTVLDDWVNEFAISDELHFDPARIRPISRVRLAWLQRQTLSL